MFNLGKKYGAYIKTRRRVINAPTMQKAGQRAFGNENFYVVPPKIYYCSVSSVKIKNCSILFLFKIRDVKLPLLNIKYWNNSHISNAIKKSWSNLKIVYIFWKPMKSWSFWYQSYHKPPPKNQVIFFWKLKLSIDMRNASACKIYT